MASQIKVNEIIKQSGSSISIGESGDTINLAGSAYAAAGDNTPMFDAYLSADATFSDASATKIQFNTETIDTDSAYDNSSNFRFTVPSGEAGKYLIYGSAVFGTDTASGNGAGALLLYKNGAVFASAGVTNHNANNPERESQFLSQIYDLSVGDYLEFYVYCDTTGSGAKLYAASAGSGSYASQACRFGGHKLIG